MSLDLSLTFQLTPKDHVESFYSPLIALVPPAKISELLKGATSTWLDQTLVASSLYHRAGPESGALHGVSEGAAVSGCCRYERRLYEDWCQTVSEKSQYNLSLPLLHRDPNTKQLSVNFSPQVSWVTVTST